ncbi:cytochrome p450 [Colletotrichum sojae]|uniref:Cytochrome p450 n=1 Tax=Colletotrichum sojae TaxID=2175907 RepID=A0A8H6IMK2_9PEZI|nr:cytochrome p450 [Colletotrichum sojae]
MLGILTARVMVDDEAPHNQTWVTLTTEFVQSGVAYSHALKFWSSYLRPLICRFLPQHSEVQGQLNDGRKILIDAIRKMREREENGVPEPQPASVLYHMSRKAPGTSSVVIDMHLKEQMNLAVGAIHTTSSVLTQTIFELAAHTDYISELRKEAIDTLAKLDGVFSKAALSEMHKLDSFIQEAHRLNSPNLTSVQRLATQDVTLSDGTFLPKGTKLEFPAYAFHLDDDLHENAAQFDGFRFFRKRQEAGEGVGGKHHYVGVRKDMLGWGYGKNACPGRFMADVEIKLVVAFLLMNYEIKNPDGQGRYQNVHLENQVTISSPTARKPD